MDKIIISALTIPAFIGVYSHEHQATQMLSIDLEMSVDIDRAAETDNISDAVDYSQVHREIISFVQQSRFRLLETLIKSLADHLKNQFKLSWLKLSITKRPRDMPDVDGVRIEIERNTEPKR